MRLRHPRQTIAYPTSILAKDNRKVKMFFLLQHIVLVVDLWSEAGIE